MLEMERVVFPFLTVLIVACVAQAVHEDVSFTRYTSEVFTPTEKVEVFPEDVERRYIIIGELKMTFASGLSYEESLNRMKDVAREVGANAIIGVEKEIIEAVIPEVPEEPLRRKTRYQPMEISGPEAREERVILRGLAIRYR